MLTTRQFAVSKQPSTSSLFFNIRYSWKTVTLFLGAQFLATFYAFSVSHCIKPCQATNTELLHNPSIKLFYLLFLTVEVNSTIGLMVAVYNALLMTSLLGWPKVLDIQTSRRQAAIHVVSIVGVISMRMLLGYIFGRGTGWAVPILFFNDAIHETTCGLSVIVLYFIMRRVYSNSGIQRTRPHYLMYLLLWTPNAFHGPIFFWSFSVASITGITALFSLILQRRESISRDWLGAAYIPSKWKQCLIMIKTFLVLVAGFVIISYVHYIAYRFDHEAHSHRVSTLPEPILTQFLLLSYPRRNDSTILSSTLHSYSHSLDTRFFSTVYTTVNPASHTSFRDAQATYKTAPGLNFISDPHPTSLSLSRPVVPGFLPQKQTFDVYSALSWAGNNVQGNTTRYIGIMEDDFEWCSDGWNELKAIIYEVALREQSEFSNDPFCGIFIATGGSGLLIRPSTIPMLQTSLQRYAFNLNPDIILQDCLRGALLECAGCRLAASRRMLLRHTGASQSTYRGRVYPEDRWQCGWRQPFNGRLGVWVP